MNQARKFAGEPRTPIVAMQWANWAQGIAGRHTPTAARHQRVAMTLAFQRLVFQSARWETNAWTWAPQIRLAITPFLTPSILKIANERQMRRETETRRTLRGRTKTGYAGTDAQNDAERQDATNRPLNPGSRNPRFVFQGAYPAEQPMQRTAIERILARIQDTDARTRLEQLLLEPNAQLVQRLMQMPQRVEERTAHTPFVLQNPAAAAAHTAQEGQGFDHFERPISRERTGRAPWETPNALPINLEQLTDQVARRIDNRITAYRERRGKGA